MSKTINLSFRYAKSDIVRAMRAHNATQMRPRLDIFLTATLAAAGAYFWSSSGSHWFGIFCVAVSGAFLLILLAAFVIIPPLAFRLNPKYRDDYSLTFSPDGIHFRTVHVDSQLQWSLYSRALVDAYSYVLYHGARMFTVIPKRVFQNSEEQNAFERMLGQHIPKIIAKK